MKSLQKAIHGKGVRVLGLGEGVVEPRRLEQDERDRLQDAVGPVEKAVRAGDGVGTGIVLQVPMLTGMSLEDAELV